MVDEQIDVQGDRPQKFPFVLRSTIHFGATAHNQNHSIEKKKSVPPEPSGLWTDVSNLMLERNEDASKQLYIAKRRKEVSTSGPERESRCRNDYVSRADWAISLSPPNPLSQPLLVSPLRLLGIRVIGSIKLRDLRPTVDCVWDQRKGKLNSVMYYSTCL